VEPSEDNGLKSTSEIMVDKITSVPREKTNDAFGHLEDEYLKEVERLLAVWLGIAS
jgi:mRNA interferase MazF